MHSLTREQIREIDRRAIEEFGIPGILLMENAGRNATTAILDFVDSSTKLVFCILCGRGNNGGDGFVIARHLSNQGHAVHVLLIGDPAKLSPDAQLNHDIAKRMHIPIDTFEVQHADAALADADVLIDALLGTGFSGEVRPPYDRAIELFNAQQDKTRVAIDVPSGLDCNTGSAAGATIRAQLTVTFVAPKIGFDVPQARQYTGQVVVADIGAPRALLDLPTKS